MTCTVTQIINVTAKHIAEGIQAAECECPIALAIRDQILTNNFVEVSSIYVLLDKLERADLPAEAQRFVRDFDAGKPVEPFAFALDVPVGNE